MKHGWLTSVVAALCFLSAQARITWLETRHDFGAFDEDDGDAVCEFRMVNQSDEPVEIVSVRTSCGCTVADAPTDDVMPGDTAAVRVVYNPIGRPGRFTKKVFVETSASPRQTLVIEGVVIGNSNTLRSRYPVDAGDLKLRTTVVPFGDVKKNSSKSAYIEIYNASTDTLRPLWSGLPPYINLTVTNPAIAPGEQSVCSMLILPEKTPLYGLVTDSVFVAPHPGDTPTKIDLVAIISEDFDHMTDKQLAEAPRIDMEPKSIDFGRFSADSGKITRTAIITNNGRRPLQIRRIYTTDPGVEVTIDHTSVKRGKSATVTVTVDPALLPTDLLNSRIQVIANDPQNPVTTLRAVGEKK